MAPDSSTPFVVTGTGTKADDLDARFKQEPRWLGGDANFTIDLGGDRSLWIFGDSFVATSPERVRNMSTLARNTVAVQTGRDLATATMDFAWVDGDPPTAFFPNRGDHWFWPGGGMALPSGKVIVLLNELQPATGPFPFEGVGWQARVIAGTTGAPETWTQSDATVPADTTAQAIACTALDGDHLVAVVTGEGYDGALARWSVADLEAGTLATPQWWDGAAWGTTHVPVIPEPAPECSLSAYGGGWIYVSSVGFGGTTIGIQSAAAITGPYSSPAIVFDPPESQVADAFVYAGKAHPQLGAGNELIVTYADNSFTFADLFDPAKRDTLYWPHVARITLSP